MIFLYLTLPCHGRKPARSTKAHALPLLSLQVLPGFALSLSASSCFVNLPSFSKRSHILFVNLASTTWLTAPFHRPEERTVKDPPKPARSARGRGRSQVAEDMQKCAGTASGLEGTPNERVGGNSFAASIVGPLCTNPTYELFSDMPQAPYRKV